MPDDYSENTLIEQPAITLFAELGYETIDAFREKLGAHGTLGRETTAEVVLVPRLRRALRKLNPGVSDEAIDGAVEELARDRSTLTPVRANHELYRLLKDGVKVAVRGDEDEETVETVRVIDWNDPRANDFLLVSQLWISGEVYKRRADLVGFVNGLPLVFVELKAAHRRLEDAYNDNLKDYRTTIPQLWWYNALIVLSNGTYSRVGSISAQWEHFAEWKRVADEGEQGVISLETMIRGACAPARLLDLVENFTLFGDLAGAPSKILAKNHQFLGVNNAFESLRRGAHGGRLGVFWHTQGSGKSYSMIFFSQKVLRKLPGNWTFLIVTDRDELDEQIYRNFAAAGAVTEKQVRARSGAHLRTLLRADHRNIFTLIHKFQTDKGGRYPVLSERSNVVVIVDEAHRTQYETLALNMRNALPNARFIGFTGTPLMAGEEKTREVFGDYVSVYNFRQSVEDGATVPLFYENRIPELQLTASDLDERLAAVVDAADLDEAQERRLERDLSRQYHLITREDRLEKIAADIVDHFIGRGQLGKAMVIAIDKATTLRMYDKVQRHWQRRVDDLRFDLRAASPAAQSAIESRLRYMETTDMAVVISQAQNEVEEFRQKGLDISPHRRRMLHEDLESKFKDSDDPLRIVFVTAMWITGFDVPSLSTIYLDKPLRNHTLMQAIARANRVFAGKLNGLIVDYVGIFRDLQRALAIYASDAGSGVDLPVRAKAELVAALRQVIADATSFCQGLGFQPEAIVAAAGFMRVKLLGDAVEAILRDDETKRRFFGLAARVARLYKAVLPDTAAVEFMPSATLFAVIVRTIAAETPQADISEVMAAIGGVLDASIAADEGYVIRETPAPYRAGNLVDLSRFDFEALQQRFQPGRKRTEAEKLRGALAGRIRDLVRLNSSRAGYLERFQRLIDEYNAGARNVDEFWSLMLQLTHDLNVEEQRAVAETLSEEELALFDLLTRPENPSLAKQERELVKQVARDLIATLKREKLVLDWRKRQVARAQVLVTIRDVLDHLPAAYSAQLYEQKCGLVYQHIYDSYFGQGRGVYQAVA